MIKKKYILLSLGIALLFTFTACGNSAAKETKTDSSALEQISDSQGTDTASGEKEDVVSAANAPMEETSEAITKEISEYVPGTLTETGYESEWLGLRFTAPEGTSMIMQDDSTYEMFCQNDDQTANIGIIIEDLPAGFQTVAQYVDQFEKEISSDSDISYKVLSDKDEVPLGSYIFRSVSFTATYNGAELYQSYFLRFMGDKIATVFVTYSDASIDTAGELISAFEAY